MKLLMLLLLTLLIALSSAMFNSENMVHMPYYAYVTFTSPQMSFYGGGALISSSHILTSGANTHGFTSWRIGLGSNRRTTHQVLTTNRGIAHPNYSGENNMRINDVGILFLQQPVTLSINVFPIFLPRLATSSKPHPFINEQGMVLGYAGSTTSGQEGLENLQAAYVRSMPHDLCRPHYANSDPSQHFCAHDVEFGSNFCLGDQGGALTILTREQEILVGIATLPGCTTIPSLYTRVSLFRQWINSETGV